ncbi:MAG: hypothetical protein ACXVJ1_10845 [Candidatus Angelobacter sp.]
MKILLSLLLIGLFAGNRCSSQGKGQDHSQAWVERLKTTPVARMEAGLPEASFADWFADLVKPSQTEYEVKECQETPAAPTSQKRLLCVFAYTKPLEPDWNRAIQLNFVVGILTPSQKGTIDAKPVPCRFLSGFEGPSNPRMKRPTRWISKLSELERLLRGSATRPNS